MSYWSDPTEGVGKLTLTAEELCALSGTIQAVLEDVRGEPCSTSDTERRRLRLIDVLTAVGQRIDATIRSVASETLPDWSSDDHGEG